MEYPLVYLFLSLVLGCVNASAAQDDRPGSGIFEGSYDFDARGRLMALTKPDGQTIRYEYRDDGLPISITTSKDSTRFAYDKNGNCLEAANSAGRTRYSYDALNQLTKVLYDYPVLKKSVEYEYDPQGRTTRVSVVSVAGAEEFYTSYEYDIIGRLRRISSNNQEVEYTYDPNGHWVKRILPNGIISIYSYGANKLISTIAHTREKDLLARFEYKYDTGGLLKTANETLLDKTIGIQYQHDSAERLVSAVYSDGHRYVYGYDSMSNRTFVESPSGRVEAKYDLAGRLSTYGKTAFRYDGNGNTVAIEEPDRVTGLVYNADNMVERLEIGKESLRYEYSAEGLLIGRITGDAATSYVPDPRFKEWRPLVSGDGMKYIWANDSVISSIGDSQSFFLEDRIGSARLVINGTFEPRAISYLPFGDAENFDKTKSFVPLFAGLFYDPFGGFYVTSFRPYKSAIGRFLSCEPEKYKRLFGSDSIEADYIYCKDNPLNLVDRDGAAPYKVGGMTKSEDEYYWKRYNENMFGGASPTNAREKTLQEINFYRDAKTLPVSETIFKNEMDMYQSLVAYHINQDGWVHQFKANAWALWASFSVHGLSEASGFGSWARKGAVWFSPTSSQKERDLTTLQGGAELALQFALAPLIKNVGVRTSVRGIDLSMYGADKAGMIGRFIEKTGNALFDASYYAVGHAKGLADVVDSLSNAFNFWRTQQELKTQQRFNQYPQELEFRAARLKTPEKISPRDTTKAYAGPFPPDKFGGAGVPTRDALSSLGDRWQPKGVKFDKSAEFFGRIGAIAGVNFDPKTKRLTLIGDGNPELPAVRLDDFIAAIQVVYGDHPGEPEDPTFSLDPENPANPAGDWLRAVYSPGMLAGTHMGDVMFKADWMLKQYAFGVIADQEGNIIGKRVSSVGEYKSYMELFKRDPSAQKKLAEGGEICSRFWILPLEMKLARSGNTLIFIRSTMQVQTRRMELVDGQLKDSPDNSDPAAENFANIFTTYYDELARESPVLEEAREAAKVVAIVKWLKDKGMGANDFKIDWSTTPRSDDYVKKVRSLSISACGEWGIGQSVRLVGGVELSPIPIESSSTAASVNLASGIEMKLNSQAATSVTQMEGGTGRYLISSLPVTQASGDFIRQHPITVHDGVTYAADTRLRARRAFDAFGNNAIYDYDGAGRITGVHFFTPQNWQLHGSISDTGAKSLTLHTPNGDDVACRFQADGVIADISIDGRPVTRFSRSKTGESVEIERLKTFEEFPIGDISAEAKKVEKVVSRDKIVYGNGTVQYIREPGGDRPAKSETISCKFSDDKMILEATGVAPIIIEKNGKTGVVEKSSDEQTTYEYAPDGNGIKKIIRENGDSMEFFYGGKEKPGLETVLKVRKGSATAEVARSNNSIVIRDFRGAETIYRYEGNRLQGIESPLGKTVYSYDDKHLTAIHYPDGSMLRFDWAHGAGVDRVSVWREAAV
ncbi:MAG: hypothetical protein Q8N91_04365 [Candidatus Omnitrophota bacterium]|nr:hypothetical protein [Candidatus Omnitrophota bacterium]